MRIKTAICIIILFSSCHSYLDLGKNIQTNYLEFDYFKNYNKFMYKSNVNAIADTEIYYKTNFSINIPKKIINWKTSGNDFFFEYCNKQIFCIHLSDKKNKNATYKSNWVETQPTNTEIFDLLYQYWRYRGYKENQLKIYDSRMSKIYTDGNTTILFFNIKNINRNKYLNIIKSFEYLQ